MKSVRYCIQILILSTLLFNALHTGAQNSQLCVFKGGKIVTRFPAAHIDSIAVVGKSHFVRLTDAQGKVLYSALRSSIDSISFLGYATYPEYDLNTLNQLTGEYVASQDQYNFATTGGDPYVYTKELGADLPEDSCVLTFEYKCPKGIADMQVFFCNAATGYYASENYSQHVGNIPAGSDKQWKTYSYNVSALRKKYNWGAAKDRLRIDFGYQSDVAFNIRSFRLRGMTDEERKAKHIADSIENAKLEMDAHLQDYLAQRYTNFIDSVNITNNKVCVAGTINEKGNFVLVEIPPYVDITETAKFAYRTPLTDNKFSVELDRTVPREGCQYDRLLSKWAIVRVEGDKDILASHARYADEVTPSYSAQPGVLLGKKGLGAGGTSYYYADFDSLQVRCATINIVLNALLYKTQGSGFVAYTYGGRTYYINTAYVAQLDQALLEAQKRNINVSAIILATTGSMFTDPENTGGHFTMPNMTTAQAVNDYAASLNYLARRYASGAYGRIHHWIMHNEVDQGQTWTNMGVQPQSRYNDRYVKSMRICYNIVRKFDQNASVLASYTHNWCAGGADGEYSPKEMLEQTVAYSRCEGDFKWGIAYHPYPVNLGAPRYWIDDAGKATYDMKSTYVTFHNPEVINAWVKDVSHFYKGKTKRILFFSENGTNSKNYSERQLAYQAAGAALIWKKVRQLDGIDGIMWHNWKDNADEGGLRIGLRAFADGDFKEFDVKPSWKVWQAADTEKEDEVFGQYLETLGLTDWNGIIHEVRQ